MLQSVKSSGQWIKKAVSKDPETRGGGGGFGRNIPKHRSFFQYLEDPSLISSPPGVCSFNSHDPLQAWCMNIMKCSVTRMEWVGKD